MPKFTQEMVNVLIEGTQRAYRSPFTKILPFVNKASDDKYYAEIKDMRDTATDSKQLFVIPCRAILKRLFWYFKVVNKRKQNPIEKKDLLTLMLEGKDPKTGEGLSDIAIVNNVSDSTCKWNGRFIQGHLLPLSIAYYLSRCWAWDNFWDAYIYNVPPTQKSKCSH